MTTFKEIRGTAIQVVSSDPANPETGQIWYNSSSGTLKGYVYATVNAWASGGSLSSSVGYRGSAGTQTAALAIGGYVSPPGARSSATEEYDGTAWTSGGSLGTARYLHASLGTQTAALMATGQGPSPFPASAEKYNGTSWTSAGNVNTARRALGGAGTDTAGLIFGGGNPSVISPPANVESYNGTSWTSSGNYPTNVNASGFAGTQGAGLAFAGENSAPPFPYTNTNSWNGSTWTSLGVSMANNRQYQNGSCGTQTAALAISGSPGPVINLSEEWTGSQFSTKTVTVS